MHRTSDSRLVRSISVFAITVLLTIPSFAQDSNVPDSRERFVLVSIPDRKLVVVEDESIIASFAVAVGAGESPSPTGEFRVINRVSNPTYYQPGSVIPAGNSNPVGTRWIGLNRKGYGIHGTNAPRSIGRAASHGCIRLRNRDVERLFTILRVGDRVEIHGARDEKVARYFGSLPGKDVLAEAKTVAVQADGGQ